LEGGGWRTSPTSWPQQPATSHLDRSRLDLDSGRAKLLDDPTADPPANESTGRRIGLLLAVARRARAHGRQPWPLSARVRHARRRTGARCPSGIDLGRPRGVPASRTLASCRSPPFRAPADVGA
jgi:hypothetical protein